MPIASMDDKHLVNMINLIFQKIMQVKQARATGDTFKARLYGVEIIDDEVAADLINEMMEKMAPYLAEAYLRGLEEPRVMLQSIYDRKERLAGFDNLPPMLGRGNVDMDLGFDEGDPDEGDR
jgi:hypothetical protein